MNFFSDRVQNIVRKDCYGRQNLFASKVGVSPSSVGNYITGSSSPKAEVLQNILEAFPEISTDWLVLGVGAKYKPSRKDTFMEGKFPYRGGVLENMQAHIEYLEKELDKVKVHLGLAEEKKEEKVEERPEPSQNEAITDDDDDTVYIYHKGPNN